MATDTVTKPRKRNDAYTGILAVSFLALVGGCVLLYLDLEQYKDGDKLKKAPDPLKIDVPGAQMKVVPGSGTAPPPKKEPPPMEPMEPPPMMMRDDSKRETVPVVLPPLEAVNATKPSAPPVEPVVIGPTIRPVQAVEPVGTREEPVIQIPDLELPPPPKPVDLPMNVKVTEMPQLQGETKTVAPVTAPSLNDDPPIVPKRFQPPM